MDQRLQNLQEDFLRAAENAVVALRRSVIELPESNMAWASSRFPKSGSLNPNGAYRKHGYGCAVCLDGLEVDFDFDERGQIKAPDAFRLINFCGERLAQYGFKSKQELASAVSGGV